MEQITIEGLAVDTLIGVYDWERTQLTTLYVDIQLDADLTAAMKSDDVNDTIDYAKVAEVVQNVGKRATYELLEALGNEMIDTLLAQFAAQKVTVKIVKPNILPDAQRVSVTMAKQK